MLIHPDGLDPVEAVRVIDQHTPALGQNGTVRGIPRHPQALGNPGHRQMLTDDPFQRPAQPAAGKLRPRLGSLRDILPPHITAPGAAVTAEPHQQYRGPPTEGFMTQSAGHRVPRDTLAPALTAPIIRIGDTASQDGTIRADILTRHLQAEPVKPAE